MGVIERVRAFLRRLLGVPSLSELDGRLSAQTLTNLAVVEGRLKAFEDRMRYRESVMDRHEQEVNKLYADVERVASQTTIAVDDMLELLVTTRKEWQAAEKVERERREGNERGN